jgi:hypothetical protein
MNCVRGSLSEGEKILFRIVLRAELASNPNWPIRGQKQQEATAKRWEEMRRNGKTLKISWWLQL